MTRRIGFIQGRLSDRVAGKIQAFPWRDWENEFRAAQELGFAMMEWTLDQDRLYENPLMTPYGRQRIRELSIRHGMRVPSLTGDCFMQAPFYKVSGERRASLLADLHAILAACATIGIRCVVFPLVDNGRIEIDEEEESLVACLMPFVEQLASYNLKIAFESDFAPERLARFIARFPSATFGINYDIGNSAAFGYDPAKEIVTYGRRIVNVHVKDRAFAGETVPLGTGNADFGAVFSSLARVGYQGNFILQTARAEDNDHAATLSRYRDMTVDWLCRYAA